jgi:hypothetical protein
MARKLTIEQKWKELAEVALELAMPTYARSPARPPLWLVQ